MRHTQEEWIKIYQERAAIWKHDGNPRRPHMLLRSDQHSSGFCYSELILEDPWLLQQGCRALAGGLHGYGLDLERVDRVVGPAMGAVTLAHDLAREIRQLHGQAKTCFRAYTEKIPGGDGKALRFDKSQIRPGEQVLLVEDVLTTGGSVERSAELVEQAGGVVLPYVAALLNRSGQSKIAGREIVALINLHMPTWSAEECPLCREGSRAIGKSAENWTLLNAEY